MHSILSVLGELFAKNSYVCLTFWHGILSCLPIRTCGMKDDVQSSSSAASCRLIKIIIIVEIKLLYKRQFDSEMEGILKQFLFSAILSFDFDHFFR